MPDVTMHFIQFDDLGGRAFDLSDFFAQGFDPLVDGDMTKAQVPANRSKAQAFQIQVHRQPALGWGPGIGFVRNRIKVLSCFALVSLSSLYDSTFYSDRT